MLFKSRQAVEHVSPHCPAGTGKLQSIGGCAADVIGLDWAVDIADARATLGQERTIQVCALVPAALMVGQLNLSARIGAGA